MIHSLEQEYNLFNARWLGFPVHNFKGSECERLNEQVLVDEVLNWGLLIGWSLLFSVAEFRPVLKRKVCFVGLWS